MKNKILLLMLLTFSIQALSAEKSSDDELLDLFHKKGITHCDKIILEHASLKDKPHWSYDIYNFPLVASKGYSEVTVVEVFGYKDDSVKFDLTFQETPNECTLTKRVTITFNGPCSDNISGDYWFIDNKMDFLDYTKYKNKNGAPLLAKEVSVGNFKVCIEENQSTVIVPHSKIDNLKTNNRN
jgi:hypothetical protein